MRKKITKPALDTILVAVVLVVSYVIFARFDVLEMIVELSRKYEDYEIDEIVSTLIVLVLGLVFFSIRRLLETLQAKRDIEKKNDDLQKALEEVKTLTGVIPICAHCKEIRDDEGSWNQLEQYISEHSTAQFSHGICEKCLKKYYPEEAD